MKMKTKNHVWHFCGDYWHWLVSASSVAKDDDEGGEQPLIQVNL